MPDPYQVLGVAKGASFDDIKAAFRRASKQRHPDMPGGSRRGYAGAVGRIWTVLKDLRQAYAAKSPPRWKVAKPGARSL